MIIIIMMLFINVLLETLAYQVTQCYKFKGKCDSVHKAVQIDKTCTCNYGHNSNTKYHPKQATVSHSWCLSRKNVKKQCSCAMSLHTNAN